MATLLIALPVPSGTEQTFDGFLEEVKAHMDDFAQSRGRVGATQESYAFQDMPDGSQLFLLCIEGDDPAHCNSRFAASQQIYDRWFKDSAGPILNADFDQLLPPITRTVFDWHA